MSYPILLNLIWGRSQLVLSKVWRSSGIDTGQKLRQTSKLGAHWHKQANWHSSEILKQQPALVTQKLNIERHIKRKYGILLFRSLVSSLFFKVTLGVELWMSKPPLLLKLASL
ncbi:MAG: hypothetical protein KME11_07715 [Timaviella obliquedivisa GSE-PSE-MK23-08B]|nr:hypothetical protein [Timaviella obliquedivisa GSE-PSE-MK23-08B]